jgi:8-oxo-dGTP pyrophosphatase MutT (NUDIX family)
MTEITIVPIERLELALVPRPWPFARDKRAEIDAHFDELQRANPALWNGRVLLLHDHSITGAVFHGAYLETDYASMLAWREWNADTGIRNCFGMGALRGSDGGFVLGVMGAHTANAGRIYFPAGLPDLSDLDGTRVDLAGNVMREVAEETGLAPADFEAAPGWITVLAGPRIAQIKLLQTRDTAAALAVRIRAHLASEREPELADVRIVRGPADFDPMMPDFVTAFLTHVWGKAS